MLTNFSREPLTIPKSTIVGVAESMSEPLIDRINARKESSANTSNKPPRKRRNEVLYDKLLHSTLDHLSRDDRQHIEPVLKKCAHVFHGEE
jgi:hypothetical protein